MNQIEKPDWLWDYIVQWRPTDMCNYDCSYCAPSNHLKIQKERLPTIERLIRATDNIRASIPKDKTVLVYLTGGEPFLIPNIHLWFEHMAQYEFTMSVFTNGSMPIPTYLRCESAFEYLRIMISFHTEWADIDHIVRLANTIQDRGGKVEIRAMLANGMFDRVAQLVQRLPNTPITELPVFPLYSRRERRVNPVNQSSRNLKWYDQTVDDGSLEYYTQQELEYIQSGKQPQPNYLRVLVDGVETNAATIVRNNQNKFQGWHCAVTDKKILIEANGDVQYGCCGATGIIGNIFEPLKLFEQPWAVCPKRACLTIDEVMISKKR